MRVKKAPMPLHCSDVPPENVAVSSTSSPNSNSSASAATATSSVASATAGPDTLGLVVHAAEQLSHGNDALQLLQDIRQPLLLLPRGYPPALGTNIERIVHYILQNLVPTLTTSVNATTDAAASHLEKDSQSERRPTECSTTLLSSEEEEEPDASESSASPSGTMDTEFSRSPPLDQSSLACSRCGQLFENRVLLKLHENVGHRLGEVTPDVSRSSPSSSSSISSKHIVSRRKLAAKASSGSCDEDLQCCLCHRGFQSSSHLQQHMRIHTNNNAAATHLANTAAASLLSSSVFDKMAAKKRKYSCAACGKAFNNHSNLVIIRL